MRPWVAVKGSEVARRIAQRGRQRTTVSWMYARRSLRPCSSASTLAMHAYAISYNERREPDPRRVARFEIAPAPSRTAAPGFSSKSHVRVQKNHPAKRDQSSSDVHSSVGIKAPKRPAPRRPEARRQRRSPPALLRGCSSKGTPRQRLARLVTSTAAVHSLGHHADTWP